MDRLDKKGSIPVVTLVTNHLLNARPMLITYANYTHILSGLTCHTLFACWGPGPFACWGPGPFACWGPGPFACWCPGLSLAGVLGLAGLLAGPWDLSLAGVLGLSLAGVLGLAGLLVGPSESRVGELVDLSDPVRILSEHNIIVRWVHPQVILATRAE